MDYFERKEFKKPRKVKYLKPRPPDKEIEYYPPTGWRAALNSPVVEEVGSSQKFPSKSRVNLALEPSRVRVKTPKDVKRMGGKKKTNKPASDVAKKAWIKLRKYVKFWSFPKYFYQRQYRIITQLRQLIIDFQT